MSRTYHQRLQDRTENEELKYSRYRNRYRERE